MKIVREEIAMKIKINPILKKEFKLGARTFRFPLSIAFYSMAFAAISFFLMIMNAGDFGYGSGATVSYSGMNTSFVGLAIGQVVMICIIVPVITASSIAGERERQTLDILLTAPISSFSIAAGKLIAALANVFMFIVGTLPALSLCFLYGGIEWHYLLIFIVDIMLLAFFVGAIGVWCSAMFKKTIVSVIMTMLMEAIFYIVPLIIYIVIYTTRYNSQLLAAANTNQTVGSVYMGWSGLLLLFDPFITSINSLLTSNSTVGIVNAISARLFELADNASGFDFVMSHWTLFGSIVMIVIGFLFLFFTARKIDAPGRKHGRK